MGRRRWADIEWIDRFAVHVAVVTVLALIALFLATCSTERPAELEPLREVTTTTT